MELTEADMAVLSTATAGDLLVLAGGVIRVVESTWVSVSYLILECQVFANCDNYAVTIIDHSILTQVPACQRCAEIVS